MEAAKECGGSPLPVRTSTSPSIGRGTASPTSDPGGDVIKLEDEDVEPYLEGDTDVPQVSYQQSSPFLFINTTRRSANARPDHESRMLVRSHVMNSFYRQKAASSQANKEETKNTERQNSVGGKTTKFKVKSASQKKGKGRQTSKSSNPPGSTSTPQSPLSPRIFKKGTPPIDMRMPRNLTGAGPIDPFAAAVLPWDSRTQELVLHYAIEIPDSIYPLTLHKYQIQNEILTMAMTDKGLLHAILAYATVHKFCFGTAANPTDIEKTEYSKHSMEVLYHQTQAIHLVNEKLSSGDVSDITIATVLILLWSQPWVKGEESIDIHVEGLKQMVKVRGGLKNLTPPLANSIGFNDSKRAMLNCSKPQIPVRFSLPNPSDITVPLNGDSIFSRSPTYLAPLLGTELCLILRDLSLFTAFIQYYRPRGRYYGAREREIFETWNGSIEHRLLSSSCTRTGACMYNINFREAVRTAAVLWQSTGLWSFPLTTSIVAVTAAHLVSVLQDSELDEYRERYPDILLWILVIGYCCIPVEGASKTFFVKQLRVIMALHDFKDQETLVRSLRRFIYMDGVYTSALARLWKEISDTKEVPEMQEI